MKPTHDTIRDLLGAYALGATDPVERSLVEAHLAGCYACVAELAELRAVTEALPLLVGERTPSPMLRDRLIAQVQSETRMADSYPREAVGAPAPTRHAREAVPAPPAPVPLPMTPPPSHLRFLRPATIWASAAILLLVFSAAMMLWNLNLRHSLDEQAQPTQPVAVQFAQPAKGAQASLVYLPTEQVMLLNVINMPKLADSQVYQVWLIDANGPVPVGVFHPGDAHLAIAANPTAYQALAVTIEPGPLGSPQPTGAKVIVAPLASHPA